MEDKGLTIEWLSLQYLIIKKPQRRQRNYFFGVNEIKSALTPSVDAAELVVIEENYRCQQCQRFFYGDVEIIGIIDLYSIYKLYKFYNSP